MNDPVMADLSRHLAEQDADAAFTEFLDSGAWAVTTTPAEHERLAGAALDLIADLIDQGDERVIAWVRARFEGPQPTIMGAPE